MWPTSGELSQEVTKLWAGNPFSEQLVHTCWTTVRQLLDNFGARGDRWGSLLGSCFSLTFGTRCLSAITGLYNDAAVMKRARNSYVDLPRPMRDAEARRQ